MNIQELKTNLIAELLNDCRERGFDRKSQFVNFFYDNYLNKNLFESPENYEFLLKSDRHQKYFFNEIETIRFLVEHRFYLLDFDKLKSYGIYKQ